ncbi:hypothetical protein DFP72DRAFT_797972 [Ephemerocybe angulata]|uniref:Integrase core domain-containing protein n=1 Tax=Ephemerocybe angulata TaxID=980116 RepID=A0A8H6IGX9_9AGAR|nr:hypothetical protein DFP72DRAFT_797972 [Tulosesus angulatus]
MSSVSEFLPKLLSIAHKCTQDGRFLLSSLPNVDRKAAEHIARQLSAIRSILVDITDFSVLTQQELSQARLWRDVRKDSLENFRQIFLHLEDVDLLCPDSPIHLTCLYLVFHQRIQRSLDETRTSWNNHTIRTARNKTPNAIYQLSRERAINAGYWHFDTGDAAEDVDDMYGEDPANIRPPLSEIHEDPIAPRSDAFASVEEEKDAGVVVTDDEELEEAREALKDMDFTVDDGNWGIDLYCQAVVRLTAYYDNCGTDEESD